MFYYPCNNLNHMATTRKHDDIRLSDAKCAAPVYWVGCSSSGSSAVVTSDFGFNNGCSARGT